MTSEAQLAALLVDAYRLGRECKPIPFVEALARDYCRRMRYHTGSFPCDVCRAEARDFLSRHRLVQLPKEPNGQAGTVEVFPSGRAEYQHFVWRSVRGQVVPNPEPGTPVYIIPALEADDDE